MDALEIIKSREFTAIQSLFSSAKPELDQTKSIEQYKVSEHDVFDQTIRKKKTINKNTGRKDEDGNAVTEKDYIEVNRIGMPYQELIVERRIGFLLGNKINLNPIYSTDSENNPEKKVIDIINRIWNDNKLDYRNKDIARRSWSELECAELWYLVEDPEGGFWDKVSVSLGVKRAQFSLKMKILSPELGDKLYPLFDAYGDLISFAREYSVKEEGKDINHFDVYTAEMIYKYANRGSWILDNLAAGGGVIVNAMKKIPIIYYPEKHSEWHRVQSMIDRQETIVSNHGDMNDYFGSPILTVVGDMLGFASKGEQGKIISLAENAKANYLALESPPESIKMEIDNLDKFIFSFSQTPNISFSELKSLGDLSGVALKLLFMDAHMAALNKVQTFGLGIQRRINLLKATIGSTLSVGLQSACNTLQVEPEFIPYLPLNIKEEVETIGTAVMSEIMSKASGSEKLEKLGYIPDAAMEQERVTEDVKVKSSIGANVFGG